METLIAHTVEAAEKSTQQIVAGNGQRIGLEDQKGSGRLGAGELPLANSVVASFRFAVQADWLSVGNQWGGL
jgi:hypothetical protein